MDGEFLLYPEYFAVKGLLSRSHVSILFQVSEHNSMLIVKDFRVKYWKKVLIYEILSGIDL